MTSVLQPGVKAPDLVFSASNQEGEISVRTYPGKNSVLVFFPSRYGEELAAQLAKYQAGMPAFNERESVVIGISDATSDDLKTLAQEQGIEFPLVSDADPPGATADKFGVTSPDQTILPTVFVTDDQGLIRRVYEASKYPNLPNPAMVTRAIRKLADVPRPLSVSQDDWQSGPSDAPVVLIEYADYQCGPCREAYRLLKQIVPMYEGKVLWVHRHLPLRHSHPLAQGAAEAAEAAGAQGKFWEMHDRLFEAEGALERAQLIEYARELDLDVARFAGDLNSRRFRDAVNEDFKAAVKNKIKLPPVLFINGILLDGPRTKDAICARIEPLLACTSILLPYPSPMLDGGRKGGGEGSEFSGVG